MCQFSPCVLQHVCCNRCIATKLRLSVRMVHNTLQHTCNTPATHLQHTCDTDGDNLYKWYIHHAFQRLARPVQRNRFIPVLQCAAVCCSVLQCVAVCCSVCNVTGSYLFLSPSVSLAVFLPLSLSLSLCVSCTHMTWLIWHDLQLVMGWLRLVGFLKYRSLLQNIVSFIGLFCKRDL